jgi:acylphosphatase
VIRRHVVVHGEVQGVAFRALCRREAQSRGVAGWVRNRDDGAVEAVFEGPPDAVEELCSWCRHGPRHARVESVDVSDEAVEGLTRFEIR